MNFRNDALSVTVRRQRFGQLDLLYVLPQCAMTPAVGRHTVLVFQHSSHGYLMEVSNSSWDKKLCIIWTRLGEIRKGDSVVAAAAAAIANDNTT